MSALATLLIIVPLAALQPYRAAAASLRVGRVPHSRPRRRAPARRRRIPTRPRPTGRCRSGSSRSTARVRRWTRSSRGPTPRSARRTRRAPASRRRPTRRRLLHRRTRHAPHRPRRLRGPRRLVDYEVLVGYVELDRPRSDDSCERFQYGNSSQSSFHMHSNKDDAGKATRPLSRLRSESLPRGEDQRQDRHAGRRGSHRRGAAGGIGQRLLPRAHRQDRPRAQRRERRRHRLPRERRRSAVRRRRPPLVRRVPAARPRRSVDQRRAAGRSTGARRAASTPRCATSPTCEARAPSARTTTRCSTNQLSAPELDRLVKQAGRDIPSSGDLRAVLSKAASQQNRGKVSASTLGRGDRRGAEQRRSHRGAAARSARPTIASSCSPSRAPRSRSRAAATSRASSWKLAPRYLARDDAALRDAYFKAVANIPSSGDLARVLVNAMPFAAKSPAIAQSVIASAAHGAVVGRSRERARLARRVGRGARRSAPRRLPQGRLGDSVVEPTCAARSRRSPATDPPHVEWPHAVHHRPARLHEC